MKNERALSFIHQRVNDQNFGKIAGDKSPNESWDILMKSYKEIGRVKKMSF